jgi:hypothetical protein
MRFSLFMIFGILLYLQAPAAVATKDQCRLSTATDQHSRPIDRNQENQEEDEVTDADEDPSDETILDWVFGVESTLFIQNRFRSFYLLGKSNAHIYPILTPPDRKLH